MRQLRKLRKQRWRSRLGWANRAQTKTKYGDWENASSNSTEQGFTLLEMLIAGAIAAILAAIIAPGWLGLYSANLLNTAQDQTFQAIRQAQLQALNTRQTWQVGFRESRDQVEWAVFPAETAATIWQPLTSGVRLAGSETTLAQSNNIYTVEFNHRGYVTPPFGRLSLMTKQGGKQRRCVFISTLLGALRKASDQKCY